MKSFSAYGWVAGLSATGGAFVGAYITNWIKEVQKKAIVAEVGGIAKEDAKNIRIKFEPIIDSIKKVLKETEIINDFCSHLDQCFPIGDESQDFFRIPCLRGCTGLYCKEKDLLGIRMAIFKYFDSYYAAKNYKIDQYVAQVRILDNIYFLLLHYIDLFKTLPGEENAHFLKKLGDTLTILCNGFRFEMSDMRSKVEGILHDFFVTNFSNNYFDTKRTTLVKLVLEENQKILQEAMIKQEQISLLQCCEQSINNKITMVGAIAEFFLKTLDARASQSIFPIYITEMINQEVNRDIKGNTVSISRLSQLISYCMKQTAQYVLEQVDSHNSFYERYKKNAFHFNDSNLVLLKDKTNGEIIHDDLPAFLNVKKNRL